MVVRFVKSKFRKWLVAKSNRSGSSHDPCNCPLANYMKAMGHKHVFIYGPNVGALIGKRYHRYPRWVKLFLTKLGKRKSSTLTYRETIKILDSI